MTTGWGKKSNGMCEQQSSICIWAVTRLQPDLCAAHLGQDLPGLARILVLACLYLKVAELCVGHFLMHRLCVTKVDGGNWVLSLVLLFTGTYY